MTLVWQCDNWRCQNTETARTQRPYEALPASWIEGEEGEYCSAKCLVAHEPKTSGRILLSIQERGPNR